MEYNTSRTWLEIDLDAIAENHRRIKADMDALGFTHDASCRIVMERVF